MLSLWDSLRSSTHEGNTRVTHASRRNSASMEVQGQEVLSLQDDLRCSTHLSIRWHHLKILRPTRNFLQTHLQEPEIFWFVSDAFLKRHILSFQDSYVKFLRGDLRAKVVPEMTNYIVALLEESHEEYLQASLQVDSALTRRHEKRASSPSRYELRVASRAFFSTATRNSTVRTVKTSCE